MIDMAQGNSPPISDSLFSEASAWFARLNADDVTTNDRQCFEQWRAEDPRNAQAWEEVQALFGALQEPAGLIYSKLGMNSMSAPSPAEAKHARSGKAGRVKTRGTEENCVNSRVTNVAPIRQRHVYRPATRAVSAAVIAFLIVGSVLWSPSYFQNLRSDYYTGVGERRQVTLTDGSRVTLNTDTAVAVEIGGQNRGIALLRGEAFFDVNRNDVRPFSVTAGSGTSRVAGTSFNVELSTAATVTVASGAVDVAADSDEVQLTPAQQASYGPEGMSETRTVDLMEILAWRRGQIVVHQEPLAKVIDELNRYHSGKIFIIDPAIREHKVTGAFRVDRPGAVLAAIKEILDVQAIHLSEYLVLLH